MNKPARRSHMCGDLMTEQIGSEVSLRGWCHKQRDLGALIFITLRDRSGEVQLVIDDASPRDVFEAAQAVRSEFVLSCSGTVRRREQVNREMKTGEIEVHVDSLVILSEAKTPPFYIEADSDVNESLRLEYRYLDLRRPDMQEKMILRHRIMKQTRDFFDGEGFLEIETPMFIKSTPEGARDYLVPSRVFPGRFFALPQSPQLFKQLLMVAGYDRYMQIARCFRDEDLRADRQPEFTQIDLEMSFVDEEDVLAVNERFLASLVENVLGRTIELPFKRLTYAEAMNRFGSDKPDLRFGMEIKAAPLDNIAFAPFEAARAAGVAVRALVVPGAASFSRREIDKLIETAKTYGAKTLAWLAVGSPWRGSVLKFFSESEQAALQAALGAADGDLILLGADENEERLLTSLGAVRAELGRSLKLYDEDELCFLWVTEFPLFEYSEEDERLVAKHHPFTSPRDEDIALLDTDPASVRAKAYDVVLNGHELGGGSIRIHRPEMQQKMFSLLGFAEEEAKARFGFLLDAFQYGVPPHGGLAYGLDRICMLFSGSDSIRDVIAFPKVQNSSDLMTRAPGEVDDAQLDELGLTVAAPR